MGTEKETLVNIVEDLIGILSEKLSVFLPFTEDISLGKNFDVKIKEKKEEIVELQSHISINDFREFLDEPQIHDLIRDYMLYLFLSKFMCLTKKNTILVDDVISYLLKVIEDHFEEFTKEDVIISIKKFFELLFIIISEEEVCKLFDLTLPEEDYTLFKRYDFGLEEIGAKQRYNLLIKKIRFILNKNFIPRNENFEKIKTGYLDSIKSYYEYDFIYLLGDYKFNEFYIPPLLTSMKNNVLFYSRILVRYNEAIPWRVRHYWKHIFDTQDIVYMIGGTGYGKSLFLKNIINNYKNLNIDNSQDYLVIHCDLKTYYSNGNTDKKTIIDFFKESIISTLGIENITKKFIKYYLDRGRCLILLDALDEVEKEVRNTLHRKIVSFFVTVNQNNKVCITSRDRGFIPQRNIDAFTLLSLTPYDISDYIDNMIKLGKFKEDDKETFMQQVETLISKGFLNNFLVLSLLVNIYKAEKELPENKINLYKKCFEYIAKKREEEKIKIGYNWEKIFPLMKDSTFISLSVLAAPNNNDISRKEVEELLLRQYKTKYLDEMTAELAIKEFLEFCSNRTELFIPSSVDDKYKFFHRSFFEYFYSRYIHQQSDVAQMYELMCKFDIDSEVFELSVALVKEDQEEKYQKLIEFMFHKVIEDFDSPNWNGTAFGILTLSMQVVDDVYFIHNYYNLVIKYSALMSQNKILNFNQELICTWIEKVVDCNKEKQDEFKEVFGLACVLYLLLLLEDSNMKAIVDRLGAPFYQDENSDKLKEQLRHNLSIRINDMPFYVILYTKYGSLYELMEYSTKVTFNSLLDKFNINSGKTFKKNLQTGYTKYKILSQQQKQQLMELIGELGRI